MSESNNSRPRSSGSWRTRGKGRDQTTDENSCVQTLKNQLGYRIGAYIRLSPSDEIREEGSLVSHPQRIEEFVRFKCTQEKGWGQIVETYIDKDLSGKDFNRPAFRRMCKDIKDQKINAVIVTELSRLSRNVRDFCQFKDFLEEHKAKFISLKENFDTSTPMGELMILQCISFAQFERTSIVTRIKDGARARALRGLANGGQRPLGFDPDPNHTCHLIVNESEKPIVELMFRKFIELGNIRKLQTYLNDSGYQTKKFVTKDGRDSGGKQWTLGSIHNLLTNMIYLGKREINKENRSKDQSQLKESEQYRVVDAHWPAIVTDDLFNSVQSLLEANKKKTRKYVHQYRLSGLVWCGVCGSKLVGKAGTGRNGKHFYYGHMRKMTLIDNRHLERCPFELISAPYLEEAVISRLTVLAHDKVLLASLIKNSDTSSQSRLEHLGSLISTKEEAHRKLEKQRDGLFGIVADAPGEKSKKALLEKIEDLTSQMEAVEREKESLREERKNLASSVIDLKDAFELIRVFCKEFGKLAAHEQHELLKNAVSRVVVQEDRLIVEYYASPREDILPVGPHDIFAPDSGAKSLALKKQKPESDGYRTPVRTLSNLVETVGVEPTSESRPSPESTCVVYTLD